MCSMVVAQRAADGEGKERVQGMLMRQGQGESALCPGGGGERGDGEGNWAGKGDGEGKGYQLHTAVDWLEPPLHPPAGGERLPP